MSASRRVSATLVHRVDADVASEGFEGSLRVDLESAEMASGNIVAAVLREADKTELLQRLGAAEASTLLDLFRAGFRLGRCRIYYRNFDSNSFAKEDWRELLDQLAIECGNDPTKSQRVAGAALLVLPKGAGLGGAESLAPCGLVSVEKAFLEAFGLDVAKGSFLVPSKEGLDSSYSFMTVVGLPVVMMSVQVVMVIGDDDGDVDDHDQADTDADQDLDVDDDNGDGGCTGAVGPEVAVMRFANCARFARCRNSHLSAWSRNLNFQLHRGIASSPLLRVAAEFRIIGNALAGRAFLKSWANDPEAPGALPGTAATQNTLDGIDWAHLAAEEGGVANLEEALKTAADAAQRSNKFMMELVEWLNQKFTASATEVLSFPDSVKPKQREKEIETLTPTVNLNFALEENFQEDMLMYYVHVFLHYFLDNIKDFHRCRTAEEKEVAATIAEAHSLLFSWTTALWGSPIVMVNQTGVGMSPDSAAETVPWHVPGEDAGGTYPDTVDTADEERTWSQTSHRRRRMHAAMADDPVHLSLEGSRPQSGWPEQRLSASYWGLNQASSGSSDEVAIAEEVSAVIQALAEMDALTSWSPGWSGCLDQLVVGFTAGHQIPRRTVEPDQMA
ncbi:hypothetical protein AK812_SmicGene3699 [Symbiodinium microadriaticum]|uniref:Uncharacterized protein n=1 Tax=Symbiodinium microadriaticum TaxID=2951 RepID=A0A1Q9EYF7_SYMMI|nr:hypothetical protein AK812_SmicGene3699 [Symbiodinium microadriaticum]